MLSSSSLHSATADALLLSFDPTRTLQTIDTEVRRAASLDHDVRAGLLALDARSAELSEDDQTAVATAMWAFASDRLAGVPQLMGTRAH
jgi:hypothetical protein